MGNMNWNLEVKPGMTKQRLQLLLTVIGGLLGYRWNEAIGQFLLAIGSPLFGVEQLRGQPYWSAAIGALLILGLSGWLLGSGASRLQSWEDRLAKAPSLELLSGITGLARPRASPCSLVSFPANGQSRFFPIVEMNRAVLKYLIRLMALAGY